MSEDILTPTPPARDSSGRFSSQTNPIIAVKNVKTSGTKIPPLVDLKITNPVTYLKMWWKRILANEGITITFRIKPLTTLALVVMLSGGSILLSNYIRFRTRYLDPIFPQLNVTTVNTGFSGILYADENNFYLTQPDSQAITIKTDAKDVHQKLEGYISQPVFISGRYDPFARTLIITDVPHVQE